MTNKINTSLKHLLNAPTLDGYKVIQLDIIQAEITKLHKIMESNCLNTNWDFKENYEALRVAVKAKKMVMDMYTYLESEMKGVR